MASEKKIILPEPGKHNVLITSALPYVNNVPHLGNIIGSVLSADTFSRYSKQRPNTNALYVCGTDEYGTATETAALAANLTCQELCDKYNAIHAAVYKWFQIDFDIFGRTPTKQQTDIAQDIFLKLYKNGFLEERTTLQPYCGHEKHNSFLADRFVEGECPLCRYEDARGDQCDRCGNLLDPMQLVNPRCKIDGTPPEHRDTKHVFLCLDKLQPQIEEWSRKSSKEGAWSANGIGITESWLKKGLNARGITRDLKWGTAVPLDDYEKKVLYVWFDACIGYVSITANYTEDWELWWRDPENVKLYQFMGKDNVPFHTVVFPASQIGTSDRWTQLHHLSTTEYLNYEGGKFSKSRSIGVFGGQAKETGLSPDIFRYYLLRQRPETSDTDFDWHNLVETNNNELLKNVGNFCNRVLVFAAKNYDSTVPDYTKFTSPKIDDWKDEVNVSLKEYNTLFEAVKIKAALAQVLQISSLGNLFLQNNTLDNKTFKEDPDRIAATIGAGINLIALIAAVARPFMPGVSDSILSQLGLSGPDAILIPDTFIADKVKPGHKLGTPAHLFQLIKADQEEEWREKFGGEEGRKVRADKEAAAAKKRAQEEALAAKKKAGKEAKKAKKAADAAKKAGGSEGKGGERVQGKSVEAVEKDGAQSLEKSEDAVDSVTKGVAQAALQTS